MEQGSGGRGGKGRREGRVVMIWRFLGSESQSHSGPLRVRDDFYQMPCSCPETTFSLQVNKGYKNFMNRFCVCGVNKDHWHL